MAPDFEQVGRFCWTITPETLNPKTSSFGFGEPNDSLIRGPLLGSDVYTHNGKDGNYTNYGGYIGIV